MTSIDPANASYTYVVPLHAHLTANATAKGEVFGTVAVEGVQVWADTYVPGTSHSEVLADMLRTLARALKAAP